MLFLAPAALALLSYHAALTTSTPLHNDLPTSSPLTLRGAPKCENDPSITAGSYVLPPPLPPPTPHPTNPTPSLAPADLNSRALDPNSFPHHHTPRTPPIPPPLVHIPGTRTRVWCSPSSRIYVILKVTHALAGPATASLLSTAISNINQHIAVEGDGVIAGGLFGLIGEGGLSLQLWNANNHQTTYAVLAKALTAVKYYMGVYGYGEVAFGIWDGDNQVGEGSLGAVGG